MKPVEAFILVALVFFSNILSAVPPPKAKKVARSYVSHYENVLGTSMKLKIASSSEKLAGIAESATLAEIERLSKVLSGYDANSEFSKWVTTFQQPVHVSKDLFAVLNLFDQWRKQSNGALDPAAEVICKLWKQAAVDGKLPTQQAMNNAVDQVKQTHWKLDAVTQTATHLTNTPLRLNSFAKSYIIQSATNAAMAAAKINGIIVNIGGDMVIAGDINEAVQVSNPKADAENESPIDQIVINNKAIATSGNYRRGELINGTWYSHIVDPRTGEPAGDIISATVVASSAADAGALATAFNVLKPLECVALAATIPGVDYLLITKDGELIESANWKSLKILVAATAAENKSAQKDWKNELLISLELSQQQGFAKRPFAAVWVVNSEGATVKTIALWYNKPRWIRDLREWYRTNGKTMAADPAAFSSTTSATRSPGKYTLKWDGKDDKGNILQPGKYIVYIEVVREHGGYDLLHQEINCNETAQQFNLKGNVEIGGVSLDYRKK
jgi:FAD:protein FMN transferase